MSETQTHPGTTDDQPQGALPDADVPTYEDYWGVDETYRFPLKDGHQFFEIVPMNEGAKTRYQKLTNKGIRMNQRTQDALLDVDPAGERHTLILESVVGWRIMQRDPKAEGGWSEYPCPQNEGQRKNNLRSLLEKFNPKVIQDLEYFIRTKNPWMQADMNVEEIDEEIDRLQKLRTQVLEEQAGEAGSANK